MTLTNEAIKQPTDIDRYVGMQVRTARRELKLTQEALGKMLNITFQQVQKYERGVNRISSGKLYEIAHVLKRPLDYFYPDQVGEIDEDTERSDALRRADLQKNCRNLIDQIRSIDDLEALQRILKSTLGNELISVA
ncbi:MAG: helix-turn-helix transcriptional regulator [Pseudomonadota bacterium]